MKQFGVLALFLAFFILADSKIIPIRREVVEPDPNSPITDAIYWQKLDTYNPFVVKADINKVEYTFALALYTSQSFIASSSCYGFNSYYCGYGCSTYNYPMSSYHPYFYISGNQMSVPLALWAENSNGYTEEEWDISNNIIYATSCTSGLSPRVTGVIGFGVNGNAYYNFYWKGYFTIYLGQNGTTGQLGFSIDSSKYTGACSTYYTTGNWEIAITGGYLNGNTLYYGGKAILDLASKYIVFPQNLYTQVVNYLKASYSSSCYYNTSCVFYASASSFPTITLYTSGSYALTLPPEVYLTSSGSSSTLNIVSSNYLNVNSNYSNAIILGVPFMQYYYSIFSISSYSPNVQFCKAYYPSWTSSLMGVVVVVAIILICVCICALSAKANNRRAIFRRQVVTKVVTQPVISQPVVISNNNQFYVPPTQYPNQNQFVAPNNNNNNFNNQNFNPNFNNQNFNNPNFNTQPQPVIYSGANNNYGGQPNQMSPDAYMQQQQNNGYNYAPKY